MCRNTRKVQLFYSCSMSCSIVVLQLFYSCSLDAPQVLTSLMAGPGSNLDLPKNPRRGYPVVHERRDDFHVCVHSIEACPCHTPPSAMQATGRPAAPHTPGHLIPVVLLPHPCPWRNMTPCHTPEGKPKWGEQLQNNYRTTIEQLIEQLQNNYKNLIEQLTGNGK